MSDWTGGAKATTIAGSGEEGVGVRLRHTLAEAGAHFLRLRKRMPTLAEFLATFACLLVPETGGEAALSKAWTDLMAEDRDITLLAYTALQVETRRPPHRAGN